MNEVRGFIWLILFLLSLNIRIRIDLNKIIIYLIKKIVWQQK
jgi:hypothetical protein